MAISQTEVAVIFFHLVCGSSLEVIFKRNTSFVVFFDFKIGVGN